MIMIPDVVSSARYDAALYQRVQGEPKAQLCGSISIVEHDPGANAFD
jgi:hypothetical protein